MKELKSLRAKVRSGVVIGSMMLLTASAAQAQPSGRFSHVLLVSVDGMHAVDLNNCMNGLPGVNGGNPYCPNLKALAGNGLIYTGVSTSKPSDSFPGLMTLMTGGTPRTMGIYYDVAYDRVLAPPQNTTGNGLPGGSCSTGSANGTRTEFDEGIDLDQTQLDGGAAVGEGGIQSIDPNKLERDPFNSCNPVYPWDFVRTNTIMGVIHSNGGYTAWSDKHPSYSAVAGPGDKTAGVPKYLDDYYAPEINSNVVALAVTTPTGYPGGGYNCEGLSSLPAGDQYTNDFQAIQCYDTLKVNAILNEIDGKSHDGLAKTQVPTIYGMNFQAVSVGQKLIEKGVGTGGYQDSIGTPQPNLLTEFQFVDASIGEWVTELKKTGESSSTLIIITAKHGQSPIDPSHYDAILSAPSGTSPATVLAADNLIPATESPSSAIGATEDDVSLIWLSNSSTLATAIADLDTATIVTDAGIGELLDGPELAINYDTPGDTPGISTTSDSRTPDIIVTPNIGVTYTSSKKKLAEHGGFSHDDTNVLMLLSSPGFKPQVLTDPVTTAQVAPTILEALNLNPNSLQAVKDEGTQLLPGISF